MKNSSRTIENNPEAKYVEYYLSLEEPDVDPEQPMTGDAFSDPEQPMTGDTFSLQEADDNPKGNEETESKSVGSNGAVSLARHGGGDEEQDIPTDIIVDDPLSQKGEEETHPKDTNETKESEANDVETDDEYKTHEETKSESAFSGNDLTECNDTYPKDCYSFMSLHGPDRNPIFFSYGMVVFAFQMSLLVLMVISALDTKWSNKLDSDNPHNSAIGMIIPANASPYVKATQIISILCYVSFAKFSVMDVVNAVQTFPVGKGATKFMVFSCIARGLQGFIAMLATLLLILISDSVIDIVLNFTAVNFISELDNVAFDLARKGKYGRTLEDEAKRIETLVLPPCMSRCDKMKRFLFAVGVSGVILLSMAGAVIHAQDSKKTWMTQIFRVEFGDEKLQDYSGCYELDEKATISNNGYNRNIYQKVQKDSLDIFHQFGYCIEERRWILFIVEKDVAGDVTYDPCAFERIAYSTRMQAFDISTTFSEGWFSAVGTPLDLYFLQDEDHMKGMLCEAWNNGICNDELNHEKNGYRFDGGDCCSATCSNSNCGIGAVTQPFGLLGNTPGHGFPNCQDPDMVPITIRLNNFTLSRWAGKDADPVAPTLKFQCENKSVLIVDLSPEMINKNEIVHVSDGATCNIELEDIFYVNVNLTIFQGHGNNMDTKIARMTGYDKSSFTFFTIPNCTVQKLSDYYTISDIHNNKDHSLDTAKWMNDDKSGNSFCHDEFFAERFALKMLKLFEKNSTQSLQHCLWNGIECSKEGALEVMDLSKIKGIRRLPDQIGSLKNLKILIIPNSDITKLPSQIGDLTSLESLDLSGTTITELPTEIGYLTSLESLDLSYSDITKLPSQIGDLTSLESLDLYSSNITELPTEIGYLTFLESLRFSTLVNSNITKLPTEIGSDITKLPSQIGDLTSLESLDLSGKTITELPTEIGYLTSLESLGLFNSNITKLPTEIGHLTSLESLDLSYSDITKLPTEIGYLTSLKSLDLPFSDVTKLPTEIGDLTSLESLGLYSSNITELPTEIGYLTSLESLDLSYSDITKLPTEIGDLTSLESLGLYSSDITELPTEIGYLTSLKSLDLSGTNITELPAEIGDLTSLESLGLSGTNITEIPAEICDLTSLTNFKIMDLCISTNEPSYHPTDVPTTFEPTTNEPFSNEPFSNEPFSNEPTTYEPTTYELST